MREVHKLEVSNEAPKRQPVIFTPTIEDEGASKRRAKYENDKPVGGMLRRHFWTLGLNIRKSAIKNIDFLD